MLVRKGPKCAWLNVATVTVCPKQVKVIFKFWELLQTQIRKKVLQAQTQKIVTKVERNQTRKKVTKLLQTQKIVTKVVQTQTDSDKSGSNSDGSDKSAKNSNSEETSKESEVSVEEIEVPPKSFPIYDVDSNSNSDKTEDIYKTHMDGSKISLATVSTISTEPCTPKTMVTEQSTTFPYSQSDESIQFLSEEERQDKKESEENNVTGATDEKEDIEDGQQNNGEQVKYSVDTEPVSPVETTRAPSPVPVSPVKNNGEQDSVDKRAPSPVPVSPEEKTGEKVKDSVDKGAPSPVPVSPGEKTGEQGNNNVDKESASTESSTETTDSTDSTDSASTAPTVMTDVQPSKATEEYAAVFGPQPLPQISPRQEDES